jgi:hypothetical protein
VFTALFHERRDDPDLEWLLRGIDFGQVTWEQEERSAVALRQISVDRAFQEAVDEVHRAITENGLIHNTGEVATSWRETGTWTEPPILLAGTVLGTAVRDYLLAGSTRLGCLIAHLDQRVISESARHQVWVGS